MSHQVLINFAGESIKLSCQCNLIEEKLNEVQSTLKELRTSASSLMEGQIAFFEKELDEEERGLRQNLEEYRNLLDKAKSWNPITHTQRDLDAIRQRAASLSEKVAELTGSKLTRIQTMISDALESAAKGVYRELEAENRKSVSDKMMAEIQNIEDADLRYMVYEEAMRVENKGKNLADLIAIAQKAGSPYELSKELVMQKYRSRLTKKGLDTSLLKDFEGKTWSSKTVDQIENKVNGALVDEAARQQTLKIIIKNIKDRGFLVDKHKDIKLDRAQNVVRVRARRVDGKQAEFEISLNGKFMYHFENYEGQACQKDIKPFMEDLEKVYGIHVLDQKVIWSNPDKNSTQKYQYIGHNKGKL